MTFQLLLFIAKIHFYNGMSVTNSGEIITNFSSYE